MQGRLEGSSHKETVIEEVVVDNKWILKWIQTALINAVKILVMEDMYPRPFPEGMAIIYNRFAVYHLT